MTTEARFAAATSGAQLQPAFATALKERWSTGVELASLEALGAFPRRDGGITINYGAQVRMGNSRRWSPIRFGGHLVGPGQTLSAPAAEQAFVLADIGLAVFTFPFDPALPELPDLWSPVELPSILDSAPWTERPIGELPRILENVVLGYRLEKRCVLRTVVSGRGSNGIGGVRTLVIKAMTPRRVRQAQRTQQYLRNAGLEEKWCARCPTTYAYDLHRGIQVMEFVTAPRLHDLFDSGTLIDACESAAHAIADLHAVDGAGLKGHGVEDEIASLRAAVRCASWARPEWRPRLESAAEAAAEGLRSGSSEEARCTHGDYYDKQVLYRDWYTVVLDLDGLASGDRARDVGNFSAHLRLRALQHPANARLIRRAKDKFERTYQARDGIAATRLRAWEAASLVRLAALYTLRPRWYTAAPELLAQATGIETARS